MIDLFNFAGTPPKAKEQQTQAALQQYTPGYNPMADPHVAAELLQEAQESAQMQQHAVINRGKERLRYDRVQMADAIANDRKAELISKYPDAAELIQQFEMEEQEAIRAGLYAAYNYHGGRR